MTNHRPTETTNRYRDCLNLFLKQNGKNIARIEREMRALGHHDFTRRILYARTEKAIRKPGWIERYDWNKMLNAGPRGGNTTARECAPPPPMSHSTPPGIAVHHKSSPPSQGGVAAASADGVGTPGRLPSGRCSTGLNGTNAALVSTRLRDTPHHTAPRRRPIAFREFQEWLERVSPNMTWDRAHQLYIYSKLKKVTNGSCKRLMIFLPPRHGKSELVTVRYTAWRIAQDPSMNVILGSYNQRLADRFSRKVRRVLSDAAVSVPPAPLVPEEGWQPSSADGVMGVAGGGSQPATNESRHKTNHGRCPECHKTKSSNKAAKTDKSHSCTREPSVLPFTQRQANSVSEWEMTEGGTFRAVGVGAGVTGFGASLIVVDDPVKSRAEAESETYRDKVHEWFNDDLYTRLEPDGAIILIQTRWHEDDLAGRLIKEMHEGGEQWEIVDLPALCEETDASQNHLRERVGPSTAVSNSPQTERLNATVRSPEDGSAPAPSSTPRPSVSAVQPIYDPIGRLPGEALWPSRFDEAALEKLRRKLGSYSFSALYQQRPVPAEGGLFKRKWFKQIVDAPPPNLKWKRGYDLAVSTRTTACYTASAKCAFDKDGNLYIADVMRRRMEFPEQRRYIFERIATERNTEHGIELALHGHALMQDLRRQAQLRGTSFKGIKVDADKVTRSLSWANLAEEGKVILVRGPWIPDFLDEVTRFPSGATDDQIDAVSLAVKMCKERRSVLYTF